MDDMTPTDKLRALLDERGIKWWPSDDPRCEDIITHWCVGPFKWTAIEGEKDLWLNAGIAGHEPLAPEQAIAATVGNSTDLSKRLREVHGLHAFAELFGFSWTDGSDWSWHDVACAMADAIDATTEPDEATMLKLHDRMNAALLDYESAMGIEGGNGANTVPFVIDMHSLLEDAATMVARGTCKDLGGVGADDEVVFNCSECGCVLLVFDKDGINNLCTSFIYDYPRFCPECGRRIIEEVTE